MVCCKEDSLGVHHKEVAFAEGLSNVNVVMWVRTECDSDGLLVVHAKAQHEALLVACWLRLVDALQYYVVRRERVPQSHQIVGHAAQLVLG